MEQRIEIVRGDITRQKVDAILNAANSSLLGGGGVDGAIHRAAGPGLLAECRRLGGCVTGEARITAGYNLPARHVIHTVGPVWQGGRHDEPRLLAACYHSSLELAREHRCEIVAAPAISCGVFGYPLAEAAEVSVAAVLQYFSEHELPRMFKWIMFDERAHTAWLAAFAQTGAVKGQMQSHDPSP